MNALEARKRRVAQTLFEREMADAEIRQRVVSERAEISLEVQLRAAMAAANVTAADLARLLKVPRSTVSRDLRGGLRNAKLGRVRAIADMLNADVIPILVPREPKARNLALSALLEKLKN
jgi:transcriptional antiterminator